MDPARLKFLESIAQRASEEKLRIAFNKLDAQWIETGDSTILARRNMVWNILKIKQGKYEFLLP